MANKCIWLLGLSGAGKTTIAQELIHHFEPINKCILLDGDILRKGINSDLGYTDKDRFENVRRTAEIAKLFISEGYLVVVALITPFEDMRTQNRQILGESYLEVFINTSLKVCQERDPKGLYDKVKNNELKNFTGIDSPFEIPQNAHIEIITEGKSIEFCSKLLIDKIII